MDKFLETYNLPNLNHEDTENLNRPIASKEIESVIKSTSKQKSAEQMASQVHCTKHLKRINASFFQTYPKK